MTTTYPFEHLRAKPHELELFKKVLPNIAKEMPEFFRSMEVANTSIAQKNMFGNPLGIRQDLGFENTLKVLLIACFNDGILTQGDTALKAIDIFRALTLAQMVCIWQQTRQLSLFWLLCLFTSPKRFGIF